MRIRNIMLALALLLAAAPAWAQQHPLEIEYPPLPDFDVPEAVRVELPSGMELFLLEDHELPLVNMSARIATGAVYEPAGKVGLAGITGEVMRSGGTTTVSADELNLRLENVAASVETSIGDVSGSAFMTTLKEHTDDVLALFADVLMHPAFPEDKIELAKTQEKTAISRRNDDPQSVAFREMGKLLYGADSPYARTTEYYTIDAITRDDLVAFHERFFHPNNTMLAIWGDFDADAMVEKVNAAFADWEKDDAFTRPELPPVPTTTTPGVYFIPKDDVTQSTVLIGHAGELLRSNPDYFPVQVMNDVLSGGFTSRLFGKVRTDLGLAYAVFGSYSAGYDRPGAFNAGVFSKSESTVDAARAVMDEVRSMQTDAPTEAEMTTAKEAFLNSFVFNFDSRREIVQRMMTYDYYGYPADYLDRTKQGIEDATSEDVLAVAQKYLKPDQAKVLVVGRAADFGQPLSTLGEVHEIDITIPTSAPEAEGEVSEASRTQGRDAFNAMLAALGGAEAFAGVGNIQVKSAQKVQTPMGEMVIENDMVLVVPEASQEAEVTMAGPDRFRMVQKLPMGEVTVVMNGEAAMALTPMGNQALPASQRQMVVEQLWRNLAYMLTQAGHPGLTFEHRGTVEVEGQAYEALRVKPPVGGAYTLYLDPETHRPARMAYQGLNPMTGAPAEAIDVFSNYQAVQGIMLPFTVVTNAGDNTVETTINEVVVNADLSDELFETEG